ncbi:hypothetical protein N7505_007611 [Penicillium chrysogenum]|uniref:HAT C-terminal dimerisation domain-containing protein n=1 Tax=Penicillium chrysogenum TaxID=5076 RepID=A0ABQ8WEL1_PENCH|nr:hypothetical protein N7505_007611 [Penicillium chrysogenum]
MPPDRLFALYYRAFLHVRKCLIQNKRLTSRPLIDNSNASGFPGRSSCSKHSQQHAPSCQSITQLQKSRDTGGFYGMATTLAPSKKLRFFTTKDWQGHDYAKQYRKCLEEGFKRYKQELSKENTPATVGALTDSPGLNNVIETLLDPQTSLLPESDEDDDDEIARYLAKGLNPAHPRAFWGEHEHEFPVLANVARDVFSIPASGAGAERLFNCARDICFYRRSRLRPETIRELMLHRCTSKFELEQ